MTKNDPTPRICGFIDRDTEFIGDIRFKDSFRIDGKFHGKVLSGVGLIVGESGEVDADIDVHHVAINGRVKGAIRAKEKIEIFSQGRVVGTLVAPKLIIEEGAFFQGSCQMEMKALESRNKGMGEKGTP